METIIPLVRTSVSEEEIEAVTRVMRSGQLAAGPEVLEFEGAFAKACGVKHAVALNSGTAAIHTALEAANVGSGDEVITTPFTFAATATPILMQQAIPRFVDIDPITFNADLDRLLAAAGPKTKAVIAVDLFGLPINCAALEELRSRGIAVIEDACQAIGARRDGIAAGALGDTGCFSLYATKNLMTGEGGVITTNNDEIATRARRFRQHGQGERYEYLSLGYNYRMTDIAAAIGRVQLSRLTTITNRRQKNALLYNQLLGDTPGLTIPFVPPTAEHAYHQYTIRVNGKVTHNGINRDTLRARLADRDIGSGIYYPTPLHMNPLFANLGYSKGDLPESERAATEVLSLPIHQLLSESDVHAVATAIKAIVGG